MFGRKSLVVGEILSLIGRATLVIAVLAACQSTPNPRSCVDGMCSDPRYPFCDVNGSLGGAELECIAVTCTPAETAECREDVAVVCNEQGTDFRLETCDLECTSFGCRECERNQTTCSMGVLDVCDENGQLVSSDVCAYGCAPESGDVGRCLELVPSNGLDEMAPPDAFMEDLDLATATIVVDDGTINSAVSAPTVMVPAPANGVPVRVFYGRNIRLGSINIEARTTSAAVAFVASGDVVVDGTITLVSSMTRSPGSIYETPCSGGYGFAAFGAGEWIVSGSGGGGHATPGGSGGAINNFTTPQGFRFDGGAQSGSAELVPLRGGCFGGRIPGGGAIQLSGRSVAVNGRIDARGGNGVRYNETDGMGTNWMIASGGGGGGGILLEGARVELGSNAALLASGGSGASIDADGQLSENETAAVGGAASSANSGSGGNAASPSTPAANGINGNYPGTGSAYGGGGGGGLGRIRINTSTGAFASPVSAIEAGSLTVGTAATH
jgi:hypothetical protein